MITQAAEQLVIPADNVTEPVSNAKRQMHDYKTKSNATYSLAISANETIQKTKQTSRQAIAKIEQVLKKLQDLLAKLDGLDNIDWNQLEKLENVLRNASAGGDKAFNRVSELKERQEVIVKSIAKYRLDLEEVKKQIKWARMVYDSFPDVCLKVDTPNEG